MKTVYRILQYRMDDEDIERKLDKSLADGVHVFHKRDQHIVVVTIDESLLTPAIKELIADQKPIANGCITREQAEILKKAHKNYAQESSIPSNGSD